MAADSYCTTIPVVQQHIYQQARKECGFVTQPPLLYGLIHVAPAAAHPGHFVAMLDRTGKMSDEWVVTVG
jgi:hypothetical protein